MAGLITGVAFSTQIQNSFTGCCYLLLDKKESVCMMFVWHRRYMTSNLLVLHKKAGD